MTLDEETLNRAFDAKHGALKTHAEAVTTAINAKSDLRELELTFTNTGLTGSNAEARKADLAAKTEVERHALESAEASLRTQDLNLELTNLELKRLDYLLRLLETVAQ